MFIVIHSNQKGQFYCSFQNNNGDVLAESKFYPTREACTAAQEVLLQILRERSRSGRHANVYQCAQYYYCALKQGSEILLRTRTSDTRVGCTKYWDELLACVNGSVHRYSHTAAKQRMTLPMDPKVMSYMYSLDGQGRSNLANYTQEGQWEDPNSWLWNTEAGKALYGRLFQPMPRRLPCDYTIELRTGIGPYTGTKAKVYVTLYSDTAASEEYCLESNFAEGQTRKFQVRAIEDVGELTKIRVRHDNSGEEPDYWEERQKGNNPIRENDADIAKAEREALEALEGIPPEVQKDFWYAANMIENDPEGAEQLENELLEGEYAEAYSDYSWAVWTIRDLMEQENPKRTAKDLYRSTAGEIEARDAANRRHLDAGARKNRLPDTGDERTVFADGNAVSMAIWIQTNALCHPHFYKIVDESKKYNIPIRYFSYASPIKCAEQLVLEDRKML